MSLLKAPTATGLSGLKGRQHYAVNFQYDFLGDAPGPCSLGGINFTGVIYTFDTQSIRSAANFPALRSMQFSQSYYLQGDGFDGALNIYVPSSGQFLRVGAPEILASPSPTGTYASTISGAIPIISNAPTSIQFGKEVNGEDGLMHGQLIATLFDFAIDGHMITGVSNQP
jgi:hypothetical protein